MCKDCRPPEGTDEDDQTASPWREVGHITCTSPCNRMLDCNHGCTGKHLCGDGSLCPPCTQPCSVTCSHRSCPLPCGEPCLPCLQPCVYSCPHMRCTATCFEAHFCLPGGCPMSPIERRLRPMITSTMLPTSICARRSARSHSAVVTLA
jgi:hypothetical protein